MDNVNIDYEPLVWDLNPEGIGVQPMIANVDISFKFLGGSSLFGPVNKLQNALSFNYFANTHVYDPRADYIAKKAVINIGALGENDVNGAMAEQNSTDIKATGLGDYVLFDGVEKYEPSLGKIIEQLSDIQNKEVDQVKAEEKVNGGVENTVQPTPPPPSGNTENDINVIFGFNFENYSKIDETETEDLEIKLEFVFQPKQNTIVSLTKNYYGKLYIENCTTKEKKLIDKITVSPNSSTSVNFDLKSSGGDVTVSLGDKIKFIFSGAVFIQGDEPLVSFIKTAYAGNDSLIKIEWETGSNTGLGPKLNWNKTTAKA